MAMFRYKEEAEKEAQRMLGWDNVEVVVDEDEPCIDGCPIVYILATDPVTRRQAVFDGSNDYARWI
jgi:hypothetical protein